MAGPLDGVKILDLTTIYSGPICTSILGDQGADVIKIESPEGDWIRSALAIQRNGVGGSFAMMNRNKRSLVLDLTTQEGKTVFRDMVRQVDVVVENYRPGVMERLGIGYDSLQTLNPKLVFASINGVGHNGPYANRRVYDAIIQSVSGLAALQVDPKAERPIMINSLICDKLTSMTSAQAISSALFARERSGQGQRIDIAMLEAALFFMWPDNMLNHTFVGDDVPYADPLDHALFVRQTSDGYICIMPIQQDEWLGLFKALELPNLLIDPEMLTETGIDTEKVGARVDAAFLNFTSAEAAQRLDTNQVPFALINDRADVIEDPQVVAMEALWEFEHPWAGPMRQARPPARFSQTPSEIFRCSPELGEHSIEVLEEFGFDAEKIDALRQQKVVR